MSINMEILSYKSIRRQIFADPSPKRNPYTIKSRETARRKDE